jgi:hypothetical protein
MRRPSRPADCWVHELTAFRGLRLWAWWSIGMGPTMGVSGMDVLMRAAGVAPFGLARLPGVTCGGLRQG